MLDIKQIIDRIGDYYSLEHEIIPDNQDLIQKIFDQLTQETYQSLNEREKQILDRFYTDVSNIRCVDHPEYVAPVSIYHRVIRLTPFPAEEHSDSILRLWSESTQSNEQEAYQRICSYIDRTKNSSSSTTLNLSNLDLTVLPKCLFTDPILSEANLAGNPLKEFPPELTIGSVQNLDNFEYVKKVIDSKDLQVKPTSLESELPQTELDITKTVNFIDFRHPNEFGITAYRHVFKMYEPGLLVSTGTERSFYGLIQAVLASSPNYCQGLVIRDINPKVKAYVDFNVLLLRLATNVTEYEELSRSCFPSLEENSKICRLPINEQFAVQDKYFNDSITNKLKMIKPKLDADMTMDPNIKNYYLDNLEVLAKSYYEINPDWKSDKNFWGFGEYPHYHEDEVYFNILQKYAKAGNIIATLGDIGDLEFLSTKKVSIVDISNISDYVLLDFRSNQIDFDPKIISTIQDPKQTVYKTYQHKSMSKEKKEELRDLLHLLEKWKDQRQPTHKKQLAMDIKNSFWRESFLTYYSDEVLTALKKSMAIKTRPENPSDLRFLAINNWNKLTPREIKEWNDVLQKHPGNESFLIE